MDFTFSEEQEMLRASARELMNDRYPIEHIARLADGDGFVRDEWKAVAEVGWTGISVPESAGGAGLGFSEEMVIAEELGHALYPGPFFSTVVLALGAAQAAEATELVGEIASGAKTATVAWAGPEGRFDSDPEVGWENERLTATRLFVPDLAVADVVLVVGGLPEGTGLWQVEPSGEGVTWRELPSVDTTRRQFELTLANAPATLLTQQPAGPELLSSLRNRALAALAAEAVGVGQRALEFALDHARTRQQFGRPIGAFQAVSHELARAFAELETARSLAYWAGWAVAEGAPEAGAASRAAKVRAAEAAVDTCEKAIQAHGGIGFTWEHPLHRFYKRALAIQATMGGADELRAEVAAYLLQ
ncbi:MAG TPA: acyl-CoA dehydrogenase [Actinobacteria bacterium]|jgi:alkylation response protein AidB-like acyl-CoA dehydrogenase|nr:acyl-CoA dehydrogenase [Actinomycetota bacterium]